MRSILQRCWPLLAAVGCCAVSGCSVSPLVLYSASRDSAEAGRQHVWPYFLESKPTVVAFWTTDVAQCLREIPALKTLHQRDSGVQLVTIVTGLDRMDIEKWIYRERIDYVVLYDLEEQLARRLDVESYPTFIYFDIEGEEIARETSVASVAAWFDSEEWLERSGVLPPSVDGTPVPVGEK